MNLLLPALVSFFVTLLSILPTIVIAKKYKLMDDPNLRPHPAHIHKKAIPRAGGLAIFVGLLISILLFVPLTQPILGILFAIFLLLLVGLLDDFLKDFSPLIRLILQFSAAIIAVLSGVQVGFITNPLGGVLHFNQFIATIFPILWIVSIMNMINWAKGVDGQMPGIIVVSSVIIGILSYKFYAQGDEGQLQVAILSFITAGSALGFLVFNWHPARIFPGFSGSTILGFMVAILSILAGAKLATALLVLLIPAIDFIYTFTRRTLSGKPPWLGDQKHLHHLLLQKGWSQERVALFYISASVILGTVALNLNSQGKLFTALLVGTTILGGILWLNFFGGLSRKPDRDSG